MHDQLRYALPFGPLGRLAHTLVVKRKLEHIFNFREAKVRQLFGEFVER
jgi:hypothetical protein